VVPAPVVAPPVDSESANPTPAPLIPAPAPLADVLDLQYSTETTQVLEPILDFAPDTVETQTVETQPGETQTGETQIVTPEPGEPEHDADTASEAASPEAASPEAAPSKFQRELAERKRPGAEGDRTAGSKHRAKRAKPAVPAWEDVLLGVRAHPED
ncbi:MAG: septation protein SepH, partial [Nocardioides sp.]